MKHYALVVATLAAALPAAAADYVIDPAHTFASFQADHFGTSTIRGRFDRKEGKVSFDREARSGRVEVTIETGSISTGVAPLDAHLRSKDFFDAGTHPTARFARERFVFDGAALHQVVGSLTLRGQSHPVTLDARRFNCYQSPMLEREVCGGDFGTTIPRSLWGVDYGLKLGMQDSIRLLIQVEAVRQ